LMSSTMHHTMLWQNILLLLRNCSRGDCMAAYFWTLQFPVIHYGILRYVLHKIFPGVAMQFHDQHGGLKHSTTRSHAFTLVQFGAKFHSQSKRQHVS
jgi:hypothetical protein